MMLSEKEFKQMFQNKNEVSEKEYIEIISEKNYEYNFRIVCWNGYFIVDESNNVYVSFANMNDMNKFHKQLYCLYINNLEKKDYSKEKNMNICSEICSKKCIYDFGNSESCNNCNYYNDCMIENEIDEFEISQNRQLSRQLERIENNEFY